MTVNSGTYHEPRCSMTCWDLHEDIWMRMPAMSDSSPGRDVKHGFGAFHGPKPYKFIGFGDIIHFGNEITMQSRGREAGAGISHIYTGRAAVRRTIDWSRVGRSLRPPRRGAAAGRGPPAGKGTRQIALATSAEPASMYTAVRRLLESLEGR